MIILNILQYKRNGSRTVSDLNRQILTATAHNDWNTAVL
jgi:hypothetical protein